MVFPLHQVSGCFGQYCFFCGSIGLFHDASADQDGSAAAVLYVAVPEFHPEEAAAPDEVQVVGAGIDDHQLPWVPVP